MDRDWARIRSALARIENELSKAQKVIDATDVANEWPQVTREELQAAFPRWREEYGSNWIRGFMKKRIGKENYRARRGSKKYRIAPEVLEALHLESTTDKKDNAAGRS